MSTPNEMLAAYLQAEADVLNGKTVTFQGRTVSSESLAEIRKGRQEWEARVNAANQRGSTFAGRPFSVARFD